MKTRSYKKIENKRCPYCRKDRMTIKETYRVNYPYGHKSSKVLTLIKKTKNCSKCGEIYN